MYSLQVLSPICCFMVLKLPVHPMSRFLLWKVSEAKTTLNHRTEDFRTLTFVREVTRPAEINLPSTLGGQSELENSTYPPTRYTGSSEPQETLSILGVDVPVCDRLCENRCGKSEAVLPEECYCDEVCELYGDCCLDYFSFCYSDNIEGFKYNVQDGAIELRKKEEELNPKKPVASEDEKDNRDHDFNTAEHDFEDVSKTTTLSKLKVQEGAIGLWLEEEELNRTQPVAPEKIGDNGDTDFNAAEHDFEHVSKITALRKLENTLFMALENNLRGTSNDKTLFQECQTVYIQNEELLALVVNKCPKGPDAGQIAEHVSLCEGSSGLKTIQQFVMVMEKQKNTIPVHLYSNIYCALCHGLHLESAGVEMFAPDFQCGHQTERAHQILQVEGFAQFLTFLVDNCAAIYEFSTGVPRCWLSETVGYLAPCRNETARDSSAALCGAYVYPVVDTVTGSTYRNPHCAACDGKRENSTLVCLSKFGGKEWESEEGSEPGQGIGDDAGSDFPSFSLLLDFSGEIKGVRYDERITCPAGTYHNLVDDTCVADNCGQESVLIDGACHQLDITIPAILKPEEVRTVMVVMGKMSVISAKAFMTHLLQTISPITAVRADDVCAHMPETASRFHETNVCLIVEVAFDDSKTIDLSSLDIVARLISKQSENYDISDIIIYILNYWPTSQEISCSGLGTKQVKYLEVVEVNDGGNAYSVLRTNDTMVIIPLKEVPVVWIWPDKAVATFCQPEIFSCSRILVDGNSYQTVGDSIIVDGFEGVLVGPSMYANVMNHSSVVVCSDALPNVTVTVEDSGVVEGVLSVVGISLSLCGLAFTLLTYSLFPVLRNIPGVCIMNLSVALFVAQLLFEVAPFSSGHEVLCTGLAVLEHYSWLVAFLWMNVLAYDISCTFSKMETQSEVQAYQSLRLRVFCAYAWGVPALLVLTCLLTSLAADVGFDYIDLDLCWITGGKPLVYAFGIPIALIITVNIGLFSRTAIALRAAMKIAKRAKSHGDSLVRYTVYIKLSFVMGFTWIFGFIAGLAEVDVVTYLFIITNSVQGFYICVSFALSSRARKLYKKKFGHSDVTTASSNGSTHNTKLSQLEMDKNEK